MEDKDFTRSTGVSATLLKMLEVVEAGLRDMDGPPKLSLAAYR
ncbi:MAG TPA: hypothetical protein VMN99_09050 [Anaerolineales bacterium]|nr:hypothetical protein [Anaerolineales bacterium]